MAVKPEGITTGDGTEEHPWEVHNYEEIKWCCEDIDAVPTGQARSLYVYIKLVNDIDCQDYDVDFTWHITITQHAVDFNLNNKTIKTFYIAPDGSSSITSWGMFSSGNGYAFSLHDGKILNVYGYWDTGSSALFYAQSNLYLTNISFSIDASKIGSGDGSIIYGYVSSSVTQLVKNCSFWIQGLTGRFALLPTTQSITCCDFYFSNCSCTNSNHLMQNSTIITNCRFQGALTYKTTSSPYDNFVTRGVFRNCVWDATVTLDVPATATNVFSITNGNSTSNFGIYNVNKLDERIYQFDRASSSRYIPVTSQDMDMRLNPHADTTLQELGFDVIKG